MERNKYGLEDIRKVINDIYETLKSPLNNNSNDNIVIKSYTDSEGLLHFSNLLRNAAACQRLFIVLDRVSDIDFTLNYFDKSFELENNKVDRQYLEMYLVQNLVFLDIQILKVTTNFISYFYDLPERDTDINFMEILNYLYLKDQTLCNELDKLFKSTAYKDINRIHAEMQNGCLGLTKLYGNLNIQEGKGIQLTPFKGYPVTSILSNSKIIIKELFTFLELFYNNLNKCYKTSIGYNSPNDTLVKDDEETNVFKIVAKQEKNRPDLITPIKIFNFIADGPSSIENETFIISRNYNFKDVIDQAYRPNITQNTSIKISQNKPIEVEKKNLDPQEGYNESW